MKNNVKNIAKTDLSDISGGSTTSKEQMERETRFELATFSLGRRRATTALLPLTKSNIANFNNFSNQTSTAARPGPT